LYIDVFPDKKSTSFKYYDDDGTTYNYEKGNYFLQNMQTQNKINTIVFNLEKSTGSYIPAAKNYFIRIHGNKITAASLNGMSLAPSPSVSKLMNTAKESWTNSTDVYGAVTYVKVTVGKAKVISLAK
jgi:alpha-glucosidase